jgi:hypothetical protein
MNPEINLISAMLLTKIHNISIPILGNIKVKQIIPHIKFPTEHNNALIILIHLEQDQQVIMIGLLGGMLQ